MSSKPTIATSSGIDRPSFCSACIAPIAATSLAAKMASNSCPRRSSSSTARGRPARSARHRHAGARRARFPPREGPAIAAPAVEEFREARLGGADEGDLCGGRSEADARSRRSRPAHCPIRPSCRAASAGRAPAHEMRAALDQLLQQGLGLEIVAIAEQDDPVGLVAVLIIDVPVATTAAGTRSAGRSPCRRSCGPSARASTDRRG